MKIFRPYSLEQNDWQQRTTEGIAFPPHPSIHSVVHSVLVNAFKPEFSTAEEVTFPSQENMRRKPWFSIALINSSLFGFEHYLAFGHNQIHTNRIFQGNFCPF